MRIAQVAPPLERVPPQAYGGTERIVYELTRELVRRGHEVTLFASGDSEAPGEHVVTVPQALRPLGFGGDPSVYFVATMVDVIRRADQFDLIHSHLEWSSLVLARACASPVVSTFHGRLDAPVAREALADPPPNLVAISQSQARPHPDVPWTVVYNGLDLSGAPFRQRPGDQLCFIGRFAPEKGLHEAIQTARVAGRRLRIAAKIGTLPDEKAYYENVCKPLLNDPNIEYLGELSTAERDQLVADSFATLMPGSWPEPFGLVAIESLACGTPVLARRVGALPEIIRDGVDGFFGDDPKMLAFLLDRVGELDRWAIRNSVRLRFSATRMADDYERLYAAALADAGRDWHKPEPLEGAAAETERARARATVLRAVPGARAEREPARPTRPRLPADAQEATRSTG